MSDTRDPAAGWDAFITYSHADARAARRVQHFLEGYRLPGRGDAPGRRLRVFLDRTDLRSGTLSEEIESALAGSRCLVVCCSPAARSSSWVAREIEAYGLERPDRKVSAVLLRGEPEDAVPEGIAGLDVRFSDLRDGWLLGWLRPRARVELVRVAAIVAGIDLRELIPWDRRRRRRRLAAGASVAGLLLVGVLSFPLPAWDPLPLQDGVDARERVEGAEVVDGELVLASRFRGAGPQGERNYVHLWRGVEGGELRSDWMESNYGPPRRLLPVPVADGALIERARRAVPGAVRGDAWIAEPRPESFVVVRPLPIPEEQVPQDATDPPPSGASEVHVHDGGVTSRSVVEGLRPSAVDVWSPRSFSPSDGLPVAWGGGVLWIGAPAGGRWMAPGGLWRRSDADGSWTREPGFASVSSIFVDEAEERVLVATRADSVRAGIVTRSVQAEILERPLGGGEWAAFDGPGHGDASELEIAGYLPEGPLVVRVDGSLFARDRRAIGSRLLDRWRPSPGADRASAGNR